MATYHDEKHAVVRAVSSGQGKPKPAQWQEMYSSGYRQSNDSRLETLSREERALQDFQTSARVKRAVTKEQWFLLLACYGADGNEKSDAVCQVACKLPMKGGPQFKIWAVATWSNPYLKKGFKIMDYDAQETPLGTLKERRRRINAYLSDLHKAALQQAEQVLADTGLIDRQA